jgi:5'-3' exonuclease
MQNPRNVGLFPTTVVVDYNGCPEHQAHKAVALVPFMDMAALKLQFDQCFAHLESEKRRNEFGPIFIFTAQGQPHRLFGYVEAPTETGIPGVQVHVCAA